jgi:hypothetical protein
MYVLRDDSHLHWHNIRRGSDVEWRNIVVQVGRWVIRVMSGVCGAVVVCVLLRIM